MDETGHLLSNAANARRLEESVSELNRRQQPKRVQQGLVNVGFNIAQARETLGYSAEELAHRARITPDALAQLENGSPDASVGDLLAVMYVLWRLEMVEDATDIHHRMKSSRRDP